jgi:hypothetical protein
MKLKISLGVLIVIILAALIALDQSRTYYCLASGHCVTVWKRLGGKCYIAFGKYRGVLKPKQSIATTNDNAVTIIYDGDDCIVSNDFGRDVTINKLKYLKYYSYDQRQSLIDKYYLAGKIRPGLKYFQIDIKESFVVSSKE